MKLSLFCLSFYVALCRAAPVTVTKSVTLSVRYTTVTVNGTPTTFTTDATTSTTPAATTEILPSSDTTTSFTSSTASSSTAAQESSLNSFQSAILDEHNIKRALHGVDDLTWNSTLAEYATNYAAESFSCDNVELVHSGGPYGENLAAGYVGGRAPVDAWYDEISEYNYSDPGYSSSTGHFTQVVWKSTKQLGCAYVTCDNEWRQYTICEYSPAGNVIGEFAENVLPLVD